MISVRYTHKKKPTETTCSSPSTCPSSVVDHTPEPLNYRGIINPNYPGFQHLAHTLSEHFFDEHHFAHSSEDSDLSEFETDHMDPASQNGNNGNIINNNHSNPFCTGVPNTTAHSETLTKIEEIIRGAFKSSDEDDDGPIPISESSNQADEMEFGKAEPQPKRDIDAAEGDDDGDYISYTMLDSSGEPSLDATQLPQFNAHFDIDNKADAPMRQITPDILQKTDLLKLMKTPSTEHATAETVIPLQSPDSQPDILQNVVAVAPHCRSVEANGDAHDGDVEDIVGNFEMEVEHELGRVVSGYRSVLCGEDGDGEQLLRNVQVQETLDCLMSNAEKMERSLKKVS